MADLLTNVIDIIKSAILEDPARYGISLVTPSGRAVRWSAHAALCPPDRTEQWVSHIHSQRSWDVPQVDDTPHRVVILTCNRQEYAVGEDTLVFWVGQCGDCGTVILLTY